MRISCTITLDLEKVGLWCGWLYGYMWVAYTSTSSSAKWIRTREMWELQDRVSTRIIRSDCSSFRPSVSVTSKGRASVHVYNGAIRIDQIGYRNGDISAISVYYEPVKPTRKEGRAQILQKPTQGHENFQHPWSSRRLSDMKTFKHESHVDLTCWPHMLTSHVDPACWPHESHVTWWPISKKTTLLPEDHPARRSSS